MSTVIAHRGDSEQARENTAEAFAAAVEAGADVVEVDIRTTADGTSVILHDETLLRLWGRPKHVADMAGTLAEQGDAQYRIPTLASTLRQFAELNRARRHRVTLLIDTVSEYDVRVAVDEVRRFQASDDGRLVPISWCGATEAMLVVRELLPDADLAYNHSGPRLDMAMVRRLRPSAVNLEWTLLSPRLVDQIHRMGLDVAVWTINDAWTMTLAIHAGVDRITTDRPRLLRRLLMGGASPLALAILDADSLAVAAEVGRETAMAVKVAWELAVWANAHLRTASLVTDVDLAIERHVREVVEHTFGGAHRVVGRELGGNPERDRPTWYLGPVVGTTNLVNGLPWSCMSLALAVDGEPLVASLAQPALDNVFLAAQDMGAVLNGEPLQVARCDSLAGRTVLAELDAQGLWPGLEGLLTGLGEAHCTPRLMGSGALSLAGVAAGWAAAGVVHRFDPREHLAAMLVAREAGADVVDLAGAPNLFPEDGGVLVAAPDATQTVLRCLSR
ncbi:inositol monophosphatase family protein [Luteococcus sp. Sow4_B9]|uniref:inositol monophosphatase family protein n=1 Tax=Luteococcus sp. Sow4_B9 TaxID=3438792 RepID=UPI003F9E47FD